MIHNFIISVTSWDFGIQVRLLISQHEYFPNVLWVARLYYTMVYKLTKVYIIDPCH